MHPLLVALALVVSPQIPSDDQIAHAIRFGAEQWPEGIQVRIRNPDVPLEILRQSGKGQSPIGAWIGELYTALLRVSAAAYQARQRGQTLPMTEARLIANDQLVLFRVCPSTHWNRPPFDEVPTEVILVPASKDVPRPHDPSGPDVVSPVWIVYGSEMEDRFPPPPVIRSAQDRSGSVCNALAAFAGADLASNRELYIFRRSADGQRVTFTRAPIPPEVVQ